MANAPAVVGQGKKFILYILYPMKGVHMTKPPLFINETFSAIATAVIKLL